MNNSKEINNIFFLSAERLFRDSNEAVLSMLNAKQKTFIRNTETFEKKFYTSATFHSIISLHNCGYFSDTVEVKGGKIKTPYFSLDSTKHIKASEFINYFKSFTSPNRMRGKNWVENLINNSSHAKSDSDKPDSAANLRTAIVFDLLLNALKCLFESEDALIKSKEDSLQDVFEYFEVQLKELITELETKRETYSPGKTPAPLVHIISCILTFNELNSNQK